MLGFYAFVATCFLVISIYVNFNLLFKNERLEEFILQLEDKLEEVLRIIRRVDIRGSFESDDEVGDTYMLIRETILTLEDFLTEPEEDN